MAKANSTPTPQNDNLEPEWTPRVGDPIRIAPSADLRYEDGIIQQAQRDRIPVIVTKTDDRRIWLEARYGNRSVTLHYDEAEPVDEGGA